MTRQSPEKRRAYEAERYANDPEYRERIKAKRRAYYEANREKVKARAAAHRRANPGRVWETEILRKYGLTRLAWDSLVTSQTGRCAICSEPLADKICVDHCHDTGKVRGLLCSPCNTGLGHFGDDIGRIIRAARYLNAARRVS